jgi:1-deoxy-D-xylulose-5-phosphate reductoisomerase
MKTKNIFLLGATGSIGTQVLDVVRSLNNIRVLSMAFGKNIKLGEKLIAEFKPEYVSTLDFDDMNYLKSLFPEISFGYGEEGLVKAATYSDSPGVIVNAIVGMAGLKPTVAGIKKNRDILLANKETLVVAGEIIKSLLKVYNVELIPIDSEHSAIYQCLQTGKKEDVSKVIITASGGSFRNLSRSELNNVCLEDALNHPNWKMGNKITIDSATMVNKGLEVIEAHFLFDLDYDQIETIIHPESIVHSLVEFKDNSLIAQLSLPDMRLPIQYALTQPKREIIPNYQKLSLSDIGSLNFQKMDYERFPVLALAYKVGRQGGIMPAIFNAANEAAVALFLDRKISFLEIETIIEKAISSFSNVLNPTLEEIIEIDLIVKKKILEQYEVK